MGARVRKTVTIVFSDVVGSTGLGERLDPESFQHVMTRYGSEMRRVLERHGGRVEKFIGDAVMAVFGVPVLHEDDALRAVRAALEMRAALADLNRELDRDYGVELGIRIGVHTGEVITDERALDQGLIAGDAVNAAARLTELAKDVDGLLVASWESVESADDDEAAHWRKHDTVTLRGRSTETVLAIPTGQ